MNAIVTILTLIATIAAIEGFFGNPLKKIKQKAKDAYKKKFGHEKQWHFLGFDLTEYPGTNEKYRQVNKEKWDVYYECLTAQDLSAVPEAVQGFEASSIGPSEVSKLDSVAWTWAPANTTQFQPLEYTENILLSPEDRTLRIYNLQKEHTGQYVCQIGEALAPPYFLTVTETSDDKQRKVHPESAPLPPYAQNPERIDNYDLVLDTRWGPWSPCSKCNQIGRKHRLGYCIVNFEPHEKNNSFPQISKEDYDLLRIFKRGIPCASHVLPYSIKKLDQVKKRRDEVMSGYCNVDCPREEIFEVKDKNGEVIEKVNNSAGIYSMVQGLPHVEPPVERELLFAAKGDRVVLTCPGNLNSDVPIQWQIGSKTIVPELLSAESKGRVYVSITDKIHIKTAKLSDASIYSCWQQRELAGTVRLIVETHPKLNFNHHIMLLGMVLIASTFLYVFAKAFLGRKHARNK